MPNGNEEFVDVTTTEQAPHDTGEFTDVTSGEVDADQVDQEYNYIAGNADSWFSIVQDPKTGGYGIEVPDIDFSFAKFDEETDDDTPEKLTAVESLKNTWNNSLDQLSLVDDRFYWLSEQLFGDEDSLTFKEAEARIAGTEKEAQEKGIEGGTLALEDIPDAFEEEGLIGGLAHTGAAITNAVAAFGTSYLEAAATGGAALAVDMVSGSVRDYAAQRAEEEGVTVAEAAANLGSETIIPVALGALSYRFEKAGLKGVSKAIKGLAPGAKKAIITTLNAAGKEGATEFAQGVVESFNQGFAGKRSLDEAVENVGTFLEEEALETFLQGAVGGGVTAGGGRSARKAASQLRSNEAERSIVETTEKISKIDEQLNDPNVPDDQKKILKRARTALKNEFKAAIKEPNKDVRKLNDDQINQINKRGNKINELKKELDIFEQESGGTVGAGLDLATQAVKEDINKRIQKEIDGINKIYENRSTTNIRDEEGALYYGEIDRRFKEGETAGEVAFDAIEQYRPKIRRVAQKLWEEKGFEAKGHKFEEFAEAIELGKDRDVSHSFYGLVQDYNPEIGSFGGWINEQLENRARRVLGKVLKEQGPLGTPIGEGEGEISGGQLGGTGTTTGGATQGPTIGQRLAHRLGFKQDIAPEIDSKVEKVLTSDKIIGKPTEAKVEGAFSKAARKNLYQTVKKQLGSVTGANEFAQNIDKNGNKYTRLIPYKSLANSSDARDRGWVDTKNKTKRDISTQELKDYLFDPNITDQGRSNRRENLANWIADGLFLEATKNLLQDPTIQKQFELTNEIQNDGGKAINAVRIVLANKSPISENRINAPKGTIQLVEGTTAADQMTSVLDQAWKAQGHKVQSTTNKKLAVANLVMAGIFPNKLAAEAYLEDVNGFTFTKRNGTNFIYNDSAVGLATPVHEMGHVWSGFVLANNPNLWGQVMTEIMKDPHIAMRQGNRLLNAGYYSKFGKSTQDFITTLYNEPGRIQNLINKVVQNPGHFANEIQALDEIMAGAIEVHGKNQLKQEDNAVTKALNKFWDYIGKLLAKVQGKEIQDLTSGELLDLAVNDVLTGKPGSSFAEMNIPVGNAQFEASAGSYRSQKDYDARAEAEYKAMNIVSKDNSNEGINKAYAELADHMSKDEFLDWMLKENKNNVLDLTKLQSTFLEDDADSGSVEKAWQELAGGKLTLLLGRPGKAWQNDEAKIQEKFDKNFEFFKKNEALWTNALPSEFWETLGRLKKDGTQAKESILRYEDAQYLASKAKPSGVNFSNRDAFSRIETAGKSIDKLKKLGNDAAYQKEIDDNQQVLFILGDAIQQLAEQGVSKIELASFIKSFTNTGHDITNFFRKAPRLTGYVEGIETAVKRIPEHNPPAGYIAQFLFQRASTGNWNQEAKDAIKDKFKYYLVPPSFDPGVKGLGPTSLKAGITKGFDLVKDDPFIRYAVTGADVTKFRELDGTPTVEKYGIDAKYVNEAKNDKDIALGVKRAAVIEAGIPNVKASLVTNLLPPTFKGKGGTVIANTNIAKIIKRRPHLLNETAGNAWVELGTAWKEGYTGAKPQSGFTIEWSKWRAHGLKALENFDLAAGEIQQLEAKIEKTKGFKLKFPDKAHLYDPIIAKDQARLDKLKKPQLKESKKEDPKSVKIFDFDDTLFTSNSKVIIHKPNGTTELLDTDKFPGHTLKEGEIYDFSQFDQVIDPKALPGLDRLRDAVNRGDDVIILTARTQKAEGPVLAALEAEGIDSSKVKFKGVGHSSAEAKAKYVKNAINKHGYHNVFFLDDAIKNVKAVQQAIDETKARGEAVAVKTPGYEFSEILEQSTGVEADKVFDQADITKANNKFKIGKFWLPPSAEDLKGLIYSMIPGGEKGNAALEFFDKNLFRPYSEAIAQFNKEKIAAFDSVKALAKKFDLNEEVVDGLTVDQAIRIYLFQETGQEVTGIKPDKINAALDYVANTKGVKGLVGKILKVTDGKFDKFEEGTWLAGSLQGDMFGYFNDSRRKELLKDWNANKEAIFTKENLDKLRVTHGENFVDSLENTFERQWSGRNRTITPDSSTNKLMDWLNNAVGTTMFLNMRSAALQSLSTINYLFEPGTIRGMLSLDFPGNVVKLWNSDYTS